MTTAHIQIENEVLKWSPTERVGLAERLLASVRDFVDQDFDKAWRAEIARRVEEVESGKEVGIPSEEIFPKCAEN